MYCIAVLEVERELENGLVGLGLIGRLVRVVSRKRTEWAILSNTYIHNGT